MAQATAELSEAVPYESLQPFQDHFHPTVPKQEEVNHRQGLDERRTGNPMSAITVVPLQHQVISLPRLLRIVHSLNFVQGNRNPGPRFLGLLPP